VLATAAGGAVSAAQAGAAPANATPLATATHDTIRIECKASRLGYAADVAALICEKLFHAPRMNAEVSNG
jgi:hypothetical protein